MVTHELGSISMMPLFDSTISTKQLYQMLEILDVHDALKKLVYEKAKNEANQQKSKK